MARHPTVWTVSFRVLLLPTVPPEWGKARRPRLDSLLSKPASLLSVMTDSIPLNPLVNVLNNPILLATPHLLSPDQLNLATFTKDLRGLILIDERQQLIILRPNS
eukprot:GILI01046631.1.p1 GENE.GILI01046631.1~~GILI01046631.1.p1  ORF type:complete len:105 (+),score=6.45 GILI01046631.1:123-437(+)